uniref:C2 domain-containing protein n=1 Tax=Photinus pyralis TaxID=7054 RepID=A0A1Y1M0E4_PHOPY
MQEGRFKRVLKVQQCLSRLGNKLNREFSLSAHDLTLKDKPLDLRYSSTPDIDRLSSADVEGSKCVPSVAFHIHKDVAETREDGAINLPDIVIENAEEIELRYARGKSPSSHRDLLKMFKETGDKVQKYFQKNARISDVNKRLKSQIWSSVVTIVLVEGKNLLACDPETRTSDPYVKFRLGNEKYKSKVVWRSLNPKWLEQFDLHLYDDGDQQLEVTVWDRDRTRDDFIGRCLIDLSSFEREKTHNFSEELEDGAGSLSFLLTISGTTASETISDLTLYEENPREREAVLARYAWQRTFHNIKDIGHLTVKVFKASGLASADLGGKSDPFCVVELGNARLQTQTEYKTLTPTWQKIFTFNIKDINNVLEITVFDEDRDHKVEFLGKVAIPLLRVKSGEKRWYSLKDKKLRSRAKGSCPQILLEMTVVWNPIRACIRTLNPKEVKLMEPEVKFKRQVFMKNVMRFKSIIIHFYEIGKVFQGCFEWESTLQSLIGLLFWLVLCYYFEVWMIPAVGLLIFVKQYILKTIAAPVNVSWDEATDSDIEDDDEDDKDKVGRLVCRCTVLNFLGREEKFEGKVASDTGGYPNCSKHNWSISQSGRRC